MNPFKKIAHGFLNAIKALFGKGPWADEYAKAVKIVPQALEAVNYVAGFYAAGTTFESKAKALQTVLGTPVTASDLANDSKASNILRDAARAVLKGQLQDATPNRILNMAIEIAVIAAKNHADVQK